LLIGQRPVGGRSQPAADTAARRLRQSLAIQQDIVRQLDQHVEQKRQELLRPISVKVVAAANEVAGEKGLSIVIGKNEVVCGGVDITADVLKKITGA